MGSLERVTWIVGAVVAVTGMFVGCGSDPEADKLALRAPCSLSSDCKTDLVCIFGSCHQQCVKTEDCADPGADAKQPRCVKGVPPEAERLLAGGRDPVCHLG